MYEPIVIVGAGQAAAQAIEVLRKRGHRAPISVIGDENLLPYQRPPLSKKYLAGTLERDRLLIRHAAHYEQHGVDFRLGFPAVKIDRAAHRVELADGSHLDYMRLLLATGSKPRLLPVPGSELAGVHYLRTAADVDSLRAEFLPGRHAVVIGGGYIGLEVAGTCREVGLDVTVIEAGNRVMNRAVAPAVSAFFEAEHARHGVKILCGTRVSEVLARGKSSESDSPRSSPGTERVRAVRLEDGREIAADFVLIGVGVEAEDALARDAGLPCDDGIVVDEYCRTADPAIWAAGDCARHPSIHYGMRVRIESVDNAFEQGASAALNMLGLTTVHDKVPWFWSDQYDLKLVIVGLSLGFDDLVVRGDPASRAFSVCYLKGGELIAVESINHNKDQMAARKLIPARARPDRSKLADDAIAMKDAL